MGNPRYGTFGVVVSVIHDVTVRDDPTLPAPHFLIYTLADLTVTSSDPTVRRQLLLAEERTIRRFPCGFLTSGDGKPGSLSWEFLSGIVEDADIAPFPANRVQWEETEGKTQSPSPVKNEEELIRRLLDAARCSAAAPANAGRMILPLFISFKKKVTLPTHEFEAMEIFARRKEREDDLKSVASFLGERSVALNWTSETLRKIVAEVVRASSAAQSGNGGIKVEDDGYEWKLGYYVKELASYERQSALAIAKGLPEASPAVNVEDEEDVCPICMEEFGVGAVLVSMPCACALVYHRHCLVKWLKKTDTCPTCRFLIPTPAPKKL